MERLEFMRSMQAETWRCIMKRKILAASLVACLCLMTGCTQIHDTVTEERQAQSAQTMQTEAADKMCIRDRPFWSPMGSPIC